MSEHDVHDSGYQVAPSSEAVEAFEPGNRRVSPLPAYPCIHLHAVLHNPGCHVGGGNIIQAGATLFQADLVKNNAADSDALYKLIYSGKGRMPGFGQECAPKVGCAGVQVLSRLQRCLQLLALQHGVCRTRWWRLLAVHCDVCRSPWVRQLGVHRDVLKRHSTE